MTTTPDGAATAERIVADTCERKIRYTTRVDAHRAAKAVAIKGGQRPKPYRCGHCHLWHIGRLGQRPRDDHRILHRAVAVADPSRGDW